MFDYFRNCSSSAHQVYCEDSPTKGLFEHCQSDDLDLHSRSHVHLKLDDFLACNILDNILAIIKTWHGGWLIYIHVYYAHVRFDDLELDLDFENVCKACLSCFVLCGLVHFPSSSIQWYSPWTTLSPFLSLFLSFPPWPLSQVCLSALYGLLSSAPPLPPHTSPPLLPPPHLLQHPALTLFSWQRVTFEMSPYLPNFLNHTSC